MCSFLLLPIYGTTQNPARPKGVARVCEEDITERIVRAHAGIQSSRWVTKKKGNLRVRLPFFIENTSLKNSKKSKNILKNLLTKSKVCAIIVKS